MERHKTPDISVEERLLELHEHLFKIQEELYQNGARNFMLVDLPPLKTPAICESLH